MESTVGVTSYPMRAVLCGTSCMHKSMHGAMLLSESIGRPYEIGAGHCLTLQHLRVRRGQLCSSFRDPDLVKHVYL